MYLKKNLSPKRPVFIFTTIVALGIVFVLYRSPSIIAGKKVLRTPSLHDNNGVIMATDKIGNICPSLKVVSTAYKEYVSTPSNNRPVLNLREYTITILNTSNMPISAINLNILRGDQVVRSTSWVFYDPFMPSKVFTRVLRGVESDCIVNIVSIVFKDHTFEGGEETAKDIVSRLKGTRDEYLLFQDKLKSVVELPNNKIATALQNTLASYTPNEKGALSHININIGRSRSERDDAHKEFGRRDARGVIIPWASNLKLLASSHSRPEEIRKAVEQTLSHTVLEIERLK
jgi:hypothetical protein